MMIEQEKNQIFIAYSKEIFVAKAINELFGVVTMTDMYVKLLSIMNGCDERKQSYTQQ